MFAHPEDARLTVLTGPVFDDATDLFADDTQIPSSYWKLVLWQGNDGVKAVALLADQVSLLDEFRRGGRQRNDIEADVQHFRIPISTLQARTELDFELFVDFDTIEQEEVPEVSAERYRRIPVYDFTDIPL